MPGISVEGIEFFVVSRGIVDVFTKTGWDHWSRFKWTKEGPKLIGGLPVTKNEYHVVKNFMKNM
jgi:hypothetical protein